MMVATVFMFLITAAMAKHHHSKDPNDNFFGTVNEAIHTVINDLLESINLDTNFVNKTNTKLLLTMHNDLSNIADRSFKIFEEIQKIVKDDINNQTDFNYLNMETEEDAIKLDTIVKQILNKHNLDVYRAVKRTLRYSNKRVKDKDKVKDKTQDTKEKTKVKIKPDFEDSIEFTEFVIKFLTKVNNLTLNDFKRSSKRDRFLVPSEKNLKVWDEPIKSSLRYDLDVSYDTRRSFKGSTTRLKYFPFIVSIHLAGEFVCSGCIISRDFVITAASCLKNKYKSFWLEKYVKAIYVRLGSRHTAKGGETIPVQKVYFHPQYDPENLVNNLLILELEKRDRYSRQQRRIRRVTWDKTPASLSNDTKSILLIGWGDTKEGQKLKKYPKLRVSELDLYNGECRKKCSPQFLRKEHFCAAFKRANGSVSSFDTGGPGIVGDVLVGVVTFHAMDCEDAETPTVFTKLGYYVPWIESILNKQRKTNQTNTNIIYTRRKFKRSKRFKNDKLLNNNTFHGRLYDYPDDVKSLRDTLLLLVKSDPYVVNDALYGDSYDEFSKYFKNPYQTAYEDQTSEDEETENLLEFEFEFDGGTDTKEDETNSGIPMDTTTCKTAILRKPLTDSEDEDAVNNDYTDNYEESSKEEQGFNIERKLTKKKKGFQNQKSASSESKTNRQSSDESKHFSEEIKDFNEKNKEHSKKRDSKKNPKSIYLSGTPMNGDDTEDASAGKKGRSREAVMKHEQLSKHAKFILNEGKSLATKKLFIERDTKNAQISHDRNKHINSKKETPKSSNSKIHKNKSRTSKNKS